MENSQPNNKPWTAADVDKVVLSDSQPDDRQELRHKIHMEMLAKSDTAKDLGEMTVVPLGFAVTVAMQLITRDRDSLVDEMVAEVEMLPSLSGIPTGVGRIQQKFVRKSRVITILQSFKSTGQGGQ